MSDFLSTHALAVRAAISVVIFAGLVVAELVWPKRKLSQSRITRWARNFAILATDVVILRIFLPAAAVGAAVFAEHRGWGLFNILPGPDWLKILLSLVLLDLVIYLQHVAFHKIPLLWRIHRMHHTDLDLDATSAVRFHPFEIILSMMLKMAAAVCLGVPPLAVILFEAVLNGAALFNHANIRLPKAVDAWLRLIVVTPDMHRVHHSARPAEADRNYGFNFPWWDRLFGTYRARPRDGQLGMTIGLAGERDPARLSFLGLLAMPFLPPAQSSRP